MLFRSSLFLESGFLESGFLESGFLESGFLESLFLESGFLESALTRSRIPTRTLDSMRRHGSTLQSSEDTTAGSMQVHATGRSYGCPERPVHAGRSAARGIVVDSEPSGYTHPDLQDWTSEATLHHSKTHTFDLEFPDFQASSAGGRTRTCVSWILPGERSSGYTHPDLRDRAIWVAFRHSETHTFMLVRVVGPGMHERAGGFKRVCLGFGDRKSTRLNSSHT